MKRLAAFIIGIIFILCSCSASAGSLDLSMLKDSKILSFDINNDGNAFVKSACGHQSFTHEGALEQYPSGVYSDIIIGDYYSADQVAFWRFWISYSAEKYMGITSVTLILDGNQYTFTNVGSKDRMHDYGTNVRENPSIVFGKNNMAFWMKLLLKWEALEDKSEILDSSMTMILHGPAKDLTVELSGVVLADLAYLGETYLSMAGVDALLNEDGTEMTVVYAEDSGNSGS